ncbi:hypothetical protein BCR37DRAFT_390708 [Protomyces lactucae-debilis]|uniref:Uncharacterized protein n=1 Tax=Protomyces lactucae-debilis TaxID=2754530 RepID=A0A1Y2FTU1_PROLT|nr:uncharacterized protein BCR37DRAFT_390708 [Protomyces lactucae-debilis]ORY86987.1 hypothetical protein BCR37DRAFT_390708 [Protomyces lactucae-debilis]
MSDKKEQQFGIDKTMMPEHETDPKHTHGPVGGVRLDEEQVSTLEAPKTKEELKEAARELNK